MILYLYLVESSKQIENVSIDYVKLNSISTITYLKEIIQNKIQVVSSNLYLLSSVVLIKQQNLSAIPNFEAAQFTTSDLTEGYGWIDENGMGVWSTAFSGNKTTFQQYANLNASERLYFKIPKETYKPFVSEVFNTTNFNQVPRIVIAYPVLSLKPDTISSMDYRNLDQGINQSLSSTMNIIASITNITSNKSLTEFKDQPVLFNLDSDFLKDNFEFKGIVTASINSAALDNYINNALFTRNIFNNATDSGSIVSGNDSSHNNTLSSDKPQNLDDSNIIRSPSFFLTPSFTSSSTGETLTEDLKPDILVTDNNGIVLFSSDKRIKVGSSLLIRRKFCRDRE